MMAGKVGDGSKRRRGSVKHQTIHGSRVLEGEASTALRLAVSNRYRARQLERRLQRSRRENDVPERQSVAMAMLAVEERLVKAFWTIARQPANGTSPRASNRNGLDYMADGDDLTGYVDAAGGKWESIAPRPPIPSGKEIDEANKAIEWLLYVDECRRKLLVVGATSKRGDAGRQINWPRIRQGMPELGGLSTRTCQGRYREALRIIVNELTLAQLAR